MQYSKFIDVPLENQQICPKSNVKLNIIIIFF